MRGGVATPAINPLILPTVQTTMLTGSIQKAPARVHGFDANMPITDAAAKAFYAAGFRFCLRYIGRTRMAANDLTAEEAQRLLNHGFALMPVQHVQNPGWRPTRELGTEYGSNAARFAQEIGFPRGVNVWCDLEGVNRNTPLADVIAYCNAWSDAVNASGYVPGLYVGYAARLQGLQFSELKFQHFWGAYNVHDLETPGARGWQLVQFPGTGAVAGVSSYAYDVNETQVDRQGGQVRWLVGTEVDQPVEAGAQGAESWMGWLAQLWAALQRFFRGS